ncbi:WXG100 family type VII secretion target [Streptomyces sp. RB6PN25]|uniref:WXG100 family type VII secretion target n=1 Tax=Streptomyces humicola TaxID=2953240 RepID=A0ABT1Q129_9ACTN|nr:WXG100 family type VII secretion target [Streptomyces humicola]MCQ4083628.1 WXG100 family type VII secretion target [Streptomyces humicola]
MTQGSTPAPNGGSDRLKVDLDGLEQFASTLESIRKTMDGTRKLFDAYAADLGSAKVASALDDFDSNWHDGRQEIDGKLQSLSKTADNAVKQFRQTDTKLGSEVEKSTHQEGGKQNGSEGGTK